MNFAVYAEVLFDRVTVGELTIDYYNTLSEGNLPHVSPEFPPLLGLLLVEFNRSARLARYFGVSDRYFLNLQNDLDIRELKASLQSEISSIKPYSYSTV